jgi:hypothetical protein
LRHATGQRRRHRRREHPPCDSHHVVTSLTSVLKKQGIPILYKSNNFANLVARVYKLYMH